ncbi:serine/arginine repetitive matrix protein 1-like [Mastomys coucha]|uniref:serine/arginine repetitive matrix protein 1-like n=1 Tax=Mastomys coucha TaxID=35658 RepID=UPI001261C231|nr:serine/arginine repetitive matrix protein 1-like [Mastomys coucha]
MSEGEPWSRKLDHEEERGGQGSARARLLWVCRLHFPAAPYSCCPSFVVVDIPPVAGDLCQRVSAAWAEGLAAGQDAGLSWGSSCQPILCRASVCRVQALVQEGGVTRLVKERKRGRTPLKRRVLADDSWAQRPKIEPSGKRLRASRPLPTPPGAGRKPPPPAHSHRASTLVAVRPEPLKGRLSGRLPGPRGPLFAPHVRALSSPELRKALGAWRLPPLPLFPRTRGARGLRHSKPRILRPESRARRDPRLDQARALGFLPRRWEGLMLEERRRLLPQDPSKSQLATRDRRRGDRYPHRPERFGGLCPDFTPGRKLLQAGCPPFQHSSACRPSRGHRRLSPTLRCLSPIQRYFKTRTQTHTKLAPPSTGCAHWLPQARSWLRVL